MRTLWKGAINFGLVHVPVRMYTATEDKDIHFRQLHAKCQTPINYEKRCPVCNQSVASEEIVMGYEYSPNQFVIIREEDFARIPSESTKSIDILDFVDLTEIDPVYYQKSYFLEPSPGGERPYALLKKAMAETGKIAIAKVAIRAKSSLACLRLYGNVLMMETIFYPDEIRSPQGLTGVNAEPANEREVKLAIDLVKNLSEAFNPEKYTDTYRQQLMDVIQSKISGEEVVTVAAPESHGKVVDIMEALRASLAATEKKTETKKLLTNATR